MGKGLNRESGLNGERNTQREGTEWGKNYTGWRLYREKRLRERGLEKG